MNEHHLGKDHPNIAIRLSNLALLLKTTNRLNEAEPLLRRALEIEEKNYGQNHPNIALSLNSLAQLLQATNRLSEAEPLSRRVVEILINFSRINNHFHPNLQIAVENYVSLLRAMRWSNNKIIAQIQKIAPEILNKE
jgi:tetratricopeptide (TPR) repeat protein